MGTYCIFARVVKVGRGLLEGCRIVYLATEGVIVFFASKIYINLMNFSNFPIDLFFLKHYFQPEMPSKVQANCAEVE